MAKQADGMKERIRGYVKHCLADVCQDYCNVEFDLFAADTSPERMAESGVKAEDRPRLEQLSEDYIRRIERILADLKKLK
jgi:hypothetical protein